MQGGASFELFGIVNVVTFIISPVFCINKSDVQAAFGTTLRVKGKKCRLAI
jgi:hypothetical protein